MGHRNGIQLHIGADHDRAALLVDHHAGRRVRLHLDALDLRQQCRDLVVECRRHMQIDRAKVGCLRCARAELRVDRLLDAFGSGEIGIAQRQVQRVEIIQRIGNFALDRGAAGNPAGGLHAGA